VNKSGIIYGMRNEVIFQDLGKIDFKEAWE